MDSTYAPQSPDLSSFLSSPPKTQQPYNPQHQASNQSTSYAPRSPVIPSFNSASSAHHNLHSYTNNAFAGNPINNNNNNNSEFAEYGQSSTYMPPIPALPPTHSFSAAPQPPPTSSYYSPQRPSRKAKNEAFSYSELDADAEDDYSPLSPLQPHPDMSSARGPRIKSDPQSTPSFPGPNLQSQQSHSQPQPNPQYKNPNPTNIEIKTKFPVARIKRIMQADEEVGKVAQVTPVAVSKALELFMIALVSGAAEKAREKGSKKVSAGHLKMVVEGDEQWDFLGEIVGRVGEVQEGAGGEARKRKGKGNGESESEEEEKRVKKGRGRKKKGDD